MRIDLRFDEGLLCATATINLRGAEVNTFSFILNYGFKVIDITCNGQQAKWEIIGEHSIIWYISLGQEIMVTCPDLIDEIIIKYSGEIVTAGMDEIKAGQIKSASLHNIIADELRALSNYSVWYPMKRSVEIVEHEVVVHGCPDYFILKGIYNDADETWRYGGQGRQPYNIIAYKRSLLKTVSNPYIDIYYLDESDSEHVAKLSLYYRDVLDYYNGELYPKMDVPKCEMACLMPFLTVGGAYIDGENGLIVTASIPKDESEAIQLVAHEAAHNWCTGAPSETWEDWLNETTAEWSALMYLLEKGEMDLFDSAVKRWDRFEKYKEYPPIKTEDGTRPDGVHDRGVVLLYQIYAKYGKDAVKTILQTFVSLENKSTDALLKQLSGKVDSSIVTIIERGLHIADYDLLF